MTLADGSAPWAIDADGLIVMFRLTPRGGSDAIDGVETRADGRAVVKARVRAVPSGGAANDALIALLAKALRIAPGRMSIVAGESARIKRVKMRSGRLWRGREMSARRIDGKAIAAELGFKIAGAVARLTREHGPQPGLAVVLVGDNPASEIYVRSKTARTAAAGMRSFLHKLPATVAENELLAIIKELNADPAVHGILVQLPLPPQIDPHKVIAAIAPAKDVDGFHPLTAGRLATGLPGIKPCTPLACILLAKSVHPSLAGMEGVIIGRSNIVGKPLAHLLLAENATVTIAHSKTRDLAAVARRAEMLFVAIGRPEFVKRNFIKPGATVIDVGINRVATEDGKPRLVGDVAFAEASEVAGAITPVPGGVGPMTIACLMLNTLRAACVAADLPEPAL